MFTAAVIVGNIVYFYTIGDSIGTHFSLEDETVEPYTTRVHVSRENGKEYVSAWVGLDEYGRVKNVKPLVARIILNPEDVVVVTTDGISDNFRPRGGRETIAQNIRDLLSREEPKIPTNIHDLWLRLEEKLNSLLDGNKREVTPSEKIARRILRYVKSLGRRAKEDNRTLMVYYHS